MQILWYFNAWTKDSTKPITLWVEAKNHEAARNLQTERSTNCS